MKLQRNRRAGFTLLEIMLVVIIISLLIGVAIVAVGPQLKTAQDVTARGHISSLSNSLDLYYAQAGFYPSTAQGLDALVNRPTTDPRPRKWSQLVKDLPIDPWGNPYVYKEPGTKNPNGFDVYSMGPDRKDNTGDEVGNWPEAKQ